MSRKQCELAKGVVTNQKCHATTLWSQQHEGKMDFGLLS